MKDAVGYKDLNELLLGLLETNSPTKRLLFLNEWLIQCDYDATALSPALELLELHRTRKANEGATGGKATKVDPHDALIDVIKDLKGVIKTSTTPEPKAARKTKTGDTYKRPCWVKTCSGVICDECSDPIDGCAFRWKRDGVYSSYHPTCIPMRDKALFEGVKGYREHFKLNDGPVLRLVDEVA